MKRLYVFRLLFSSLLIQGVGQINPQSNGNGQEPLDGNGYLYPSYYLSKCGLDYVHSSLKLCQRVTQNPGVLQPAPMTVSGIPLNAVIEKAFLYTGTSGNGVAITASLTNPNSVTTLYPMQIIGQDTDKCWGFAGTYTYRADVTSCITGNGNYILSGLPTILTDPLNDVDGATLLILYSDPAITTWKAQFVIRDGAEVVYNGFGYGFSTPYLDCASSYVKGMHIVADLSYTGSITYQNFNNTVTQLPNMWNVFESAVGSLPQGSSTFGYNQNFNNNECANMVLFAIYARDSCCTHCTYPPLSTSMSNITTDCLGNCLGSATATPSGGVPPYSYSWSTVPVQTTQTATGLCAGVYSVTVTDQAGCSQGVIDTVIITSPTLLTAYNPILQMPLCNGNNNGSITVNPTGGSPPYSYSWNTIPAQTTQTATGLSAGTYSVMIIDAGNCTIVSTITLTQPQVLTLTPYTQPILCSGTCTGVFSVNVNGGTWPFAYQYSTGDTVWADSLCAGTYSVVVTDTNGCTASLSVNITQPALPLTYTFTQTNLTCFFSGNGTASVTPAGGVGPYSYYWTPGGNTTPSRTGLMASSYTVTITDSIGCQLTHVFSLTQPPFLTLTANVTDSICAGDDITLIQSTNGGGTAPYSFTWNPGNLSGSSVTVSPGTNTTYTITCTDANGCSPGAQTHFVYVEDCPINYFLYVPNVFTPNNDGFNDIWKPQIAGYTNVRIRVFNRFGTIVYESSYLNGGWDGTNTAGIPCVTGVYYYTLSLDTETETQSQAGFIQLLRD